MRDPNRIDPIIARLRAAWIARPDLRLGQLLVGSLAIGRAEDRFYRLFQAECAEFGADNAPVVWPPVDRPAATPTTPGVDLEAVERAERAMTPGPWRASEGRAAAYGPGTETVCRKQVPRMVFGGAETYDRDGIVALRNAAPALIAEVRALRADKAALVKLIECGDEIEDFIKIGDHIAAVLEAL